MAESTQIEIANNNLSEAWHKLSEAISCLPERVPKEHRGRLLSVNPLGSFEEIASAHAALSEYSSAASILALRVQDDYSSYIKSEQADS